MVEQIYFGERFPLKAVCLQETKGNAVPHSCPLVGSATSRLCAAVGSGFRSQAQVSLTFKNKDEPTDKQCHRRHSAPCGKKDLVLYCLLTAKVRQVHPTTKGPQGTGRRHDTAPCVPCPLHVRTQSPDTAQAPPLGFQPRPSPK